MATYRVPIVPKVTPTTRLASNWVSKGIASVLTGVKPVRPIPATITRPRAPVFTPWSAGSTRPTVAGTTTPSRPKPAPKFIRATTPTPGPTPVAVKSWAFEPGLPTPATPTVTTPPPAPIPSPMTLPWSPGFGFVPGPSASPELPESVFSTPAPTPTTDPEVPRIQIGWEPLPDGFHGPPSPTYAEPNQAVILPEDEVPKVFLTPPPSKVWAIQDGNYVLVNGSPVPTLIEPSVEPDAENIPLLEEQADEAVDQAQARQAAEEQGLLQESDSDATDEFMPAWLFGPGSLMPEPEVVMPLVPSQEAFDQVQEAAGIDLQAGYTAELDRLGEQAPVGQAAENPYAQLEQQRSGSSPFIQEIFESALDEFFDRDDLTDNQKVNQTDYWLGQMSAGRDPADDDSAEQAMAAHLEQHYFTPNAASGIGFDETTAQINETIERLMPEAPVAENGPVSGSAWSAESALSLARAIDAGYERALDLDEDDVLNVSHAEQIAEVRHERAVAAPDDAEVLDAYEESARNLIIQHTRLEQPDPFSNAMSWLEGLNAEPATERQFAALYQQARIDATVVTPRTEVQSRAQRDEAHRAALYEEQTNQLLGPYFGESTYDARQRLDAVYLNRQVFWASHNPDDTQSTYWSVWDENRQAIEGVGFSPALTQNLQRRNDRAMLDARARISTDPVELKTQAAAEMGRYGGSGFCPI